jgi:hypothetical protein
MDIITVIAVANGIQYLYKFVKVAEVYYSSTEILHKITAKTMYKHLDNANSAYELGTFMVAAKSPNRLKGKKKGLEPVRINNAKRKSTRSNIPDNTMSKRAIKFVVDISHFYYIRRLERAEARDLKNRDVLYAERKKREGVLDKLREQELFDQGFLRDETSRYYISPGILLNDIVIAVQKNMTDPKWTPEDRNRVKALINNDGSDSVSIYDFEKYDSLFYYVDVLDRVTKRPFKVEMLGDDRVYSVKNIMPLQKHKARLTVKEVDAIESANKCVT